MRAFDILTVFHLYIEIEIPSRCDIRWKEFSNFACCIAYFFFFIDRLTAVGFFLSFNSRLFSPHQTYITLFIPSNSISAFLLRCDIYIKKEHDEMTLGKTNGTIGNRVTVIFNWIYWNLYNEHFLHILWATINVYFLFARHIVTLQKMHHHHHKSAFLIPWYWW